METITMATVFVLCANCLYKVKITDQKLQGAHVGGLEETLWDKPVTANKMCLTL